MITILDDGSCCLLLVKVIALQLFEIGSGQLVGLICLGEHNLSKVMLGKKVDKRQKHTWKKIKTIRN